jgi:hypothetical protein
MKKIKLFALLISVISVISVFSIGCTDVGKISESIEKNKYDFTKTNFDLKNCIERDDEININYKKENININDMIGPYLKMKIKFQSNKLDFSYETDDTFDDSFSDGVVYLEYDEKTLSRIKIDNQSFNNSNVKGVFNDVAFVDRLNYSSVILNYDAIISSLLILTPEKDFILKVDALSCAKYRIEEMIKKVEENI